jgi:ankyrin repeat protein
MDRLVTVRRSSPLRWWHVVGGLGAVAILLATRSHGSRWITETDSPRLACALVLLGADGGPALRSHAFDGRDDVVRALLRCGVDVDAKGTFGGTALTAAAYGNHPSTVALLLEHGADPHAESSCHTAFLIADTRRQLEVLAVLAKHDALILPAPPEETGCPPLEMARRELLP